MRWEVRRPGETGTLDMSRRALALIEADPWTLNHTQVVDALGGNAAKARGILRKLVEDRELVEVAVRRQATDGRMLPTTVLGGAGQPRPEGAS